MRRELWTRIAFTFVALLVVRLGLAIPLPGINPEIWTQIFRQQEAGLLGSANLLSGGGLRGLSILALSITPYVSAAVLVQLFAMVSGRLRTVADRGESGRRALERYIRFIALLLAALQAYGVAGGLETIDGLVAYPPLLFQLSTVLTLMAGTLFLIWLAEQITVRGIGNGIALLLSAGIVAEGPRTVANLIEAARAGLLSQEKLIAMAMLALAFTLVVVTAERARRLVFVTFAERQVGDRHIAGHSVALAFKLNPGGIVPAMFGSWIVMIVIFAMQLAVWAIGLRGRGALVSFVTNEPLQLAFSAAIMILFAFVYTAFLHDPERLARQLETYGGAVPDLAPGTSTADYIDDTLSRMTAFGAVYLAAIVMLPPMIAGWAWLPFAVGGVSLLVLVCVTLDLQAQARALLSQSR